MEDIRVLMPPIEVQKINKVNNLCNCYIDESTIFKFAERESILSKLQDIFEFAKKRYTIIYINNKIELAYPFSNSIVIKQRITNIFEKEFELNFYKGGGTQFVFFTKLN